MTRDEVMNDYFDWIYDLVGGNRYTGEFSYRKLLITLHSIEFRYLIPKDENRAIDGISLRYRFAYEYSAPAAAETYLDDPCSVLEMMVALAIKCEETMDDPKMGDRTAQWFWGMIVNLGLGSMYDCLFDQRIVREVIDRFLDRKYEPNGKGGLFTVRHCDKDLRKVEIFTQLCWYLDTII